MTRMVPHEARRFSFGVAEETFVVADAIVTERDGGPIEVAVYPHGATTWELLGFNSCPSGSTTTIPLTRVDPPRRILPSRNDHGAKEDLPDACRTVTSMPNSMIRGGKYSLGRTIQLHR